MRDKTSMLRIMMRFTNVKMTLLCHSFEMKPRKLVSRSYIDSKSLEAKFTEALVLQPKQDRFAFLSLTLTHLFVCLC